MLEHMHGVAGLEFGPEEYLADFWSHFQRIDDEFWKLERIQNFREPEEPSWVAMMEGDWDRALGLGEATRDGNPQEPEYAGGLVRRRVRIVEQPVTPYLQWEMQMLKIRGAAGEHIRVLDAHAVEHLESKRPLPELVILDTLTMYQVLYDDKGTLNGARRVDDTDVIKACGRELTTLFDRGEDLLAYFEREIVFLPPPTS
jgi:hypothetical protein